MKLYYKNTQKSGYAIISAVLLIGFLLVLTAGSFHLVLQEMFDGRGKQNYLKAYAAAEAGLETALLQVKEQGYGYYEKNDFSGDILGDDVKIAQVSYEFLGRVQAHTGELAGFGVDIIPLFWIEDTGIGNDGIVHNLGLGLELDAPDSIVWNIVALEVGVSGSGEFRSHEKQVPRKSLEESGDFLVGNTNLDAFLQIPEEKYLFIVNTVATPQNYTLTSGSDYFTLPRHDIISSGRVGNYVQNIRTHLDNTEFLGLLRYSIFSGE
ncbi:hypothetical protein LAT59_02800 [Candidatus Gracilibacteria bacterium]|nr:hypothetical protein [Candidatus Gracilibacteria bacterium]